jgi:hypothetical protein
VTFGLYDNLANRIGERKATVIADGYAMAQRWAEEARGVDEGVDSVEQA